MGLLKRLWRKATFTKALEQSGKMEMLFFETGYRVAYLTGLSSSDHQLPYLLYSNMVKLMIVLLVCGEVWYSFSATSIDEIVASINATLIQFTTIYRYKNMMDHKDMYKTLATSMQSAYFDTTTKKRKELVEFWSKRNEQYLKLLLALGNCTLAAWYIYPLVDELDYNLIVGIRLPFKYDSPLVYPFAYIIVVIAFTYISHFVMVTDLIMQGHLIHLLCQFTVLADCFENLLTDCQKGFEGIGFVGIAYGGSEVKCKTLFLQQKPRSQLTSHPPCFVPHYKGIHKDYLMYNKKFVRVYLRKLGNLVEQHKLVLSHTMNLRNTLSRPMLGQLAASGILICFIGYQATTVIKHNFAKGVMSLFFLGYNVFELYVICRWCEEITTQSQNIGRAVYFSGWESGVSMLPGVRSTVKLVIARSNKPLLFTAGGTYDLSLMSYSDLVKTSYSALTVMLRLEK